MNVISRKLILAGIVGLGMTTTAAAMNVTPDVIYGSGNANGSFTLFQGSNLEIGLRGKLRYNSAGNPENTFNWDGVNTYTFNPSNSNAPANRSIFNFDWHINTDVDGTSGRMIGDLTYLLFVDTDPGAGTSFAPFNPYDGSNHPLGFFDHSFGNNSTGNGAGVEATNVAEWNSYLTAYNVSQQSWNMGFGFLANPQTAGTYTIQLQAFDSGNNSLGQSSIDIVVTPIPAALPLLASGMGILGFISWRRRRLSNPEHVR